MFLCVCVCCECVCVCVGVCVCLCVCVRAVGWGCGEELVCAVACRGVSHLVLEAIISQRN